MLRASVKVLAVIALLASSAVVADDLTRMIQKDLVVLGYDPGNIQGELSTDTIVAISKFQAENSLEVTGEPTPQLAGIIKAKIDTQNRPRGVAGQASASASAQPSGPQVDAAALQSAQQQCLQEKIKAKAKSARKKKAFGSLVRAVSNTAARYGNGSEITRQVNETSNDIYDANATADDWERAANDLGLTRDELEECKNPT